MSEERSIQTAMWLMVLFQTLGAVDMPGSGPRKMPAPRVYVPVIVAFFILDIVADAGYGRAAKAMAWVTVLVAMTLGPFGIRLANFFNNVASNFGRSSTTGATP